MSYTTVSDVAAELGSVSITSSSTITSATVSGWIDESDAMINEMTGRVWESAAVTSAAYEYHDYDGSGFLILNHAPLISVDSLEYEEKGLGGASESWVACSEGRDETKDFITELETATIKFHANTNAHTPISGYKNIRVTYTYGYASTPAYIKRLSTLLTAKRYIEAVAGNTAQEGGGSVSVGTISVSDPNNYVIGYLAHINEEIAALSKDVIPTFKSWNYTSRMVD